MVGGRPQLQRNDAAGRLLAGAFLEEIPCYAENDPFVQAGLLESRDSRGQRTSRREGPFPTVVDTGYLRLLALLGGAPLDGI